MQTAFDWLWPITVFGGLGVFIDFMLGRARQARTRGFLEAWWIRFDDVRWNNFGRKEAQFAVHLIDRWCGPRLFSIRRLIFVLSIFLIAFPIGHLIAILRSQSGIFLPLRFSLASIFESIFAAIGLATSVSLTRLVAIIIICLCGNNMWKNIITFLMFLLINYVVLVIWAPIIHFSATTLTLAAVMVNRTTSYYETFSYYFSMYKTIVSHFIRQHDLFSPVHVLSRIKNETSGISILPNPIPEIILPYYATIFVKVVAGYIVNVVRLVTSLVFVGSFLLQPLLIRPISLLWLRIIESDKPIFTLVLGGISGAATLVSGLLNHLGG